ncbi:hypothetical protein QY048_10030 [Bradyrhizobium sp. WYCCWR 12677]|nr:hypothetical protein [Bradyrhizobium sp. WYCCWR 12677]
MASFHTCTGVTLSREPASSLEQNQPTLTNGEGQPKPTKEKDHRLMVNQPDRERRKAGRDRRMLGDKQTPDH